MLCKTDRTYSFQSTVQQTLVSSVSRMPMALILSKILSYDLSLPRYCLTEMCSACRYSGCDEAWQDHGVWESRLCTGGGRSHEGGQGSCGSPEALSCHVHAGLVWRAHMDRASRGHRCQVGSIVCSDLYSMFSAWSLFLYLHAYFTLPAPVAPQPLPPPPQHPQSSSLPCLVFQTPVLYLSSCTASQTSSRFCCCCNFLLVLIRRTSCRQQSLLFSWVVLVLCCRHDWMQITSVFVLGSDSFWLLLLLLLSQGVGYLKCYVCMWLHYTYMHVCTL